MAKQKKTKDMFEKFKKGKKEIEREANKEALLRQKEIEKEESEKNKMKETLKEIKA